MKYLIGGLIGAMLVGTAFKIMQKDIEACAFAQGAHAIVNFYVDTDGKKIFPFTPSGGDLEACNRVGKSL